MWGYAYLLIYMRYFMKMSIPPRDLNDAGCHLQFISVMKSDWRRNKDPIEIMVCNMEPFAETYLFILISRTN